MGHNRLDLCQKDKKTQFKGNNTPQSNSRIMCSYIHSSLSKYKVFYYFSPFHFRLHTPFFTGAISLYSPILFNPNLPLVDHVGDLFDANAANWLGAEYLI